MIRLEIEPYCHDCPEFKADVEEPENYYADFRFYEKFGDTVIRCENRNVCGRIKAYLEGRNK